MSKSEDSQWDGPERRAWVGPERRSCDDSCMNHSGHVFQIENNAQRIKMVEDSKPVPYANFKWTIGVVVTIFLSLFSISTYTSLKASDALADIRIKQSETIFKLTALQEDVTELKDLSTKEIARVRMEIKERLRNGK